MGQKFMDLFNNVTLRHFKFLRFVAENIDDDHVMCKITTIARSDRIDTPYYMLSFWQVESLALKKREYIMQWTY